MARQPRIKFPGAIWHVTSRGNERREIVRDDEDRLRFVRFLARAMSDSLLILHAWVLMPNHHHLLLETPEGDLSSVLKALNENVARTFNERHERVGHLFQSRFKAILVERETHLLELVRYIVLNPVRCGIVQFAGDYAWSNYRATAGLDRSPAWLETAWTLRQFDVTNIRAAREEYRKFVGLARGAEYNPWEALQGSVLGSAGFRARIERASGLASRSIGDIAEAVAAAFEITVDALRTPGRGNAARIALIHVGVAEGGFSARKIAQWLGITASGAAKIRNDATDRYACDELFRNRIDSIRSSLS